MGTKTNTRRPRRLQALALSVAFAGVGGISVAAAAPASAASCVSEWHELKESFTDKTDVCRDLNLQNVNWRRVKCSYAWGQYYVRSKRQWTDSSEGLFYVCNGTQKPMKVLIKNVKKGTLERVRGYNGATVQVRT